MNQRGASQTAFGVAALRAVHQLLDNEPKILDDPVVLKILDADILDEIRSEPEQFRSMRQRTFRSHILVRSRYAEDRLEQAVSNGVSQLVVLGAGLDTFAYRQPAWATGIRIYEVDHPASQKEKRKRLEDAGIAIPDNLEYVPMDFEKDSLAESLSKSSIQLDQPVFFSWLGVMVYLTQEAIDTILRFVVSLPRQTEIVFTFSSGNATKDRPHKVSSMETRAAMLGEPWLTFYEPDGLEQMLRSLGFSDVILPSVAEIAQRYFNGRPDGLPGPKRISIASARV
jgi:methyltransferase (TIGR00027 family)